MLRRISLLCALLLAALAWSQTLTRAPELLRRVEAQANAGSDGGVVLLELDLTAEGEVSRAAVVSSSDKALEQPALEAARQLLFRPAEIDGTPAPVRIQYESRFAPTRPAPASLSGVVLTRGSREPIDGALVRVLGQEAITDSSGRFAFEVLEPGETAVRIEAGGHEPFTDMLTLVSSERTEARFLLQPAGGQRETIVRGQRGARETTQVRLSGAELRKVAGTNDDAFRVVQNLPGVARAPFGGAALVVRGSKSWDSRIYVDEVQIPQLFHFAGLTATFNSATVESLTFRPGNFGVDFGRSIGGLVQAEVRTPATRTLHGRVDVNLFDTSALVEGPLGNGWSTSAGGRFGVTQWTLPLALNTFAPNAVLGFGVAPQYWDYQVRAEKSLGTKGRLFVSLFGSSDRWALLQPTPLVDQDIEGSAGALGSAITYHRLVFGLDHRFGPRVRSVTRVSAGFDVNQQAGAVEELYFRTTSVPVQLRERVTFDFPKVGLQLSTGMDSMVTPVAFDAQGPPPFRPNQLPEPYVTRRLIAARENIVLVEPGLFADALYEPKPWLSLRGGLRLDGELGVMRKVWVNPRLAVRVTPISWLSFHGGAAMYQQTPDWRSGQLSTTLGNPGLLPEGAWHFTVGAEARAQRALEVSVQGYYKALFHQARQTLATGGGSDLSVPGAASRYTSQGYGRAYGVEALVRFRPSERVVGWVAYTLSRFERDIYGSDTVAPGPLDQPHNLIAVLSADLPFGFTLGARFRFASGPLVTPVVSSIFDANANQYVPLPGAPFGQRLPNFVQLDARIDKQLIFDAWRLSVYLDVQNVTNAQNPEALFYNFNYTRSTYVYGIPILPTLGVRAEW